MLRILYGVSGEGSGHSSRAMEVVRHLQDCGHVVKVVSYDRGFRNLQASFDCVAIEGLHIVSSNNKVQVFKTIWHNLRRLPIAVRRLGALRELLATFRPDVVITDFEPTCAWWARLHRVPLISLDNQHRMRYMKYDSPANLRGSRWLTELVIRLMVPKPDYALATTYFFGETKNDFTFLFPPILRREVLQCQPGAGNHFLVYVTSEFEGLLALLRRFPQYQFLVYGSSQTGKTGNLEFRPFSSEGFLQDLSSCRAVIATAGFTLISEALYLGKPYLAMPLSGQFEQQLNAICLEELGCGMNASRMSVRVLSEFMSNLAVYAEASQQYALDNRLSDIAQANSGILGKLDELLSGLQPVSPARRALAATE
ncbi:MJ1255/VC2487 family glycosyltransferase [Pseudohongiella spirulinae]|uniref:MJ1255/VC2487 family glycosyltransferase n=1 Tax=Pseudohongiella spirulinae TaxID=1249552 RepID=UPI000AAA5B38|nr:MJ1255/VC2487 family glycosyltransferase [Pseudohongiella spirulinae]